jgi:hypothetical protein
MTNTGNIRNTVIIISLVATIGFGLSLTAFFIICENCKTLEEIFFDKKVSVEAICSNDPSCRPLEDVVAVDTRNFTSIGQEKVRLLQELVREPTIQKALKESNAKESQISDDIRIQIYIQREKEWANSKELTPFMKSIIHNDVSDFLRDNLLIQSDNFDNVTFDEHILTNVYGGNIAVSVRTDNYDQSQDDWWQHAFHDKEGYPFAKECEFDSSAEIFSEDLVIKIKDIDSNDFIGILNSATPCDVLRKSSVP